MSHVMQSVIEQGALSRRNISGVLVSSGSPQGWVAEIDATLARRKMCLGYVNTHTAYLLARDAGYRSVCRNFTLLNDGIGLDILSFIKYGRTFESNLNGSDFTPLFLRETRHRFRIFLLGGQPGVAEQAAIACQRLAPQHEYVGTHRGHLSEQEERDVVGLIGAARANLVIVGFGNPDQEVWIAKYAHDLDADLIIGVGALFDFLTGLVPRAPSWMQRLRLEWLHRLALEPRRLWKRYIVFTPALILQAVLERLCRGWPRVFLVGLLIYVDCPLAEAHGA
jgi:alpha-1,3-mannosyltransferase